MSSHEFEPLEVADFDAFFAEVNNGHRPYAWQKRLLKEILDKGQWPAQITAPTGTGKSAVVEIHIFANAFGVSQPEIRIPRRLVTVVNRRALVDDQNLRATRIAERLAVARDADDPGLLGIIARRLESLKTAQPLEDERILDPVVIGLLRGGVSAVNPAINDPSACAVINATPDMAGSRLLMRGYGVSRRARPREAAVLAFDCAMVIDESHLNRQLIVTARRVSQLVAMEKPTGIPPLQVVETTATPVDNDSSSIGIAEDDLGTNEQLARRLNAAKELRLVSVATSARVPKTIVSELLQLREEIANSMPEASESSALTIGCMVNRVKTALTVAQDLKKKDPSLRVKILVGRLRPADVVALKKEHPGLLTEQGDPEVDVLIATQTLEVGIDIDLAGLVTELAPATSLIQRFGRVNRKGHRQNAPVIVVVPEKLGMNTAPYTAEDLELAKEWLETLGADQNGLSPARLMESLPPAPTPRRLVFLRPEWADINQWSRTNDRLFSDDDMELWLRDDLTSEQSPVGIVVRDCLPKDDLTAMEILRQVPPESAEEFPASMPVALSLARQIRDRGESDALPARFFVFRDDDVLLDSVDNQVRLEPGDVMIVDYGSRFTREGVAVDVNDVAYKGLGAPHPISTEDLGFHLFIDEELVTSTDGRVETNAAIRKELKPLSSEEATDYWRSAHPSDDKLTTIILPTLIVEDDDEPLPWFIVKWRQLDTDSVFQQQWTRSVSPVLLDTHGKAVAERAAKLCNAVGLAEHYCAPVVVGAELHDLGKNERRFQARLGNSDVEENRLLAKGTGAIRKQRVRPSRDDSLPRGWRHEQLSVLLAKAANPEIDDLILRLIGTSHGHGRATFPHVGENLLENSDPRRAELTDLAHELFSVGLWEEIVDLTARHHGHYTVCYLEELLRAADCQVSSEGS